LCDEEHPIAINITKADRIRKHLREKQYLLNFRLLTGMFSVGKWTLSDRKKKKTGDLLYKIYYSPKFSRPGKKAGKLQGFRQYR